VFADYLTFCAGAMPITGEAPPGSVSMELARYPLRADAGRRCARCWRTYSQPDSELDRTTRPDSHWLEDAAVP
jgi:hypothetical protein